MAQFLSSSIGKKIMVALTGLVMLGFVTGHLIGNLLMFLGAQTYNHYAATIKANLLLLWGTRITLIGAVLLHVIFTVQLKLQAKASRPTSYAIYKPQEASFSSLFMIASGLILLTYIPYHILHFTTGTLHPQFTQTDVYTNVIVGFSQWPASMFYCLAMLSLGLHLNHGVYSVFQTLGINHEKINCFRRILSTFVSIVIPLGFISIPVAVLIGLLK